MRMEKVKNRPITMADKEAQTPFCITTIGDPETQEVRAQVKAIWILYHN
jgi:hypothetical protein